MMLTLLCVHFFASIYLHDKSIIRRKSNETTYIYRILEKKNRAKRTLKVNAYIARRWTWNMVRYAYIAGTSCRNGKRVEWKKMQFIKWKLRVARATAAFFFSSSAAHPFINCKWIKNEPKNVAVGWSTVLGNTHIDHHYFNQWAWNSSNVRFFCLTRSPRSSFVSVLKNMQIVPILSPSLSPTRWTNGHAH